MGRGRAGALAAAAAVALSTTVWLAPVGRADDAAEDRANEVPSECTVPTAELTPECLANAVVFSLLRQACDYHWVEELCAVTAWEDPGYVAHTDPHPSQPLALRVGAVHNHSGYSDNDYPATRPADFYKAGRTGHNTADAGGDSGIKLDFMFGSDHTDNVQIPITTAAACLEPATFLTCENVGEIDQYWKWPAVLRQAREGTVRSATGTYTGFTGVRGFEWTNDYFNHMNVYFSTNFRNVKVDGSYASMDVMWDWLRRPVSEGGGADALLTFNHPGGDPALTPFDGGLPHNEVIGLIGNSNWDQVKYVPDVDQRVAAMEVNGGDDIEWYVKALTNGWHIGAVANEDEHQLEWSTSRDGKTLILTRGRSPRDYYYAFENHRTIAIQDALVGGSPGTKAIVPTIHYYAGGSGPGGKGINDLNARVLGSTLTGSYARSLHVQLKGVPAGSRVALISDTRGGQQAPIALGAASSTGSFTKSVVVPAPLSGQDWYFVVVCRPEAGAGCGSNQDYMAVTAPIWLAR